MNLRIPHDGLYVGLHMQLYFLGANDLFSTYSTGYTLEILF